MACATAAAVSRQWRQHGCACLQLGNVAAWNIGMDARLSLKAPAPVFALFGPARRCWGWLFTVRALRTTPCAMSHTHTRAHRGFSPAAPPVALRQPSCPPTLACHGDGCRHCHCGALENPPLSRRSMAVVLVGRLRGHLPHWRELQTRARPALRGYGIWRIRLGAGSPITGDCLLVVLTWVGNNYFGHAAAALPRHPSNGCLAPLAHGTGVGGNVLLGSHGGTH